MIRLTWRQFRMQGLIAGAGLGIVAALVLVTRPHLVDLYDALRSTCAEPAGDCATATQTFLHTRVMLQWWLGVLVTVVPGLIGVFWGAPLVAAEIETGTFRLAWTQSVTRSRWLAIKLSVIGAASALTAGLLSLLVTWWASPLDRVAMDRFGTYHQRGIVPIGFAVFAFVLGVALGLVLRRSLPAMAVTLVVLVAVLLAGTIVVRPRLIAPLHHRSQLDPSSMGFGRDSPDEPMGLMPAPPDMPNAWIYSTKIVDDASDELVAAHVARVCPEVGAPPPPSPSSASEDGSRGMVPREAIEAMQRCVSELSTDYHQVTTYQPARRYWAFQWLETGIYLAIAATLAGLCFWLIRRRT